MQDRINLQVEIRKPEVTGLYFLHRWAIFTVNLHWAVVISSVAPSRIVISVLVVSSLFRRWTFICQYHEVILAARFCLPWSNRVQQALSMWHQTGIKAIPFTCVAVLWTLRAIQQPSFLRVVCAVLQKLCICTPDCFCHWDWVLWALLVLSGVWLLEESLATLTTAGDYRTNTATTALEKGWGKKEQFIGVNTGCQARQSNKFQKTIFLLWKSSTLAQS